MMNLMNFPYSVAACFFELRCFTMGALILSLLLLASTGPVAAGETNHFTVSVTSITDSHDHIGGGTFTLRENQLVYLLRLPRSSSPEIHGPASPGTDAPLL